MRASRPTTTTSARLVRLAAVAIGLAALGGGLAAAAKAGAMDVEALRGAAQWLAAKAAMALAAGLDRSPALVAGIAGLAAAPLLAVLALAAGTLAALGRRRGGAGRSPAPSDGDGAVSPTAEAWIEVGDAAAQPIRIAREMVRIGRDADNDVVLAESDLDSFHAVIARTPERGFVVFDTSGGGRGVRVNGEPRATAALADGDRIALGGAAIVFRRGGRTGAQATGAAIAGQVGA